MRLLAIVLAVLTAGGTTIAQQKKQQKQQAPLIPVPKEVLHPPALSVPRTFDPHKKPDIEPMREFEFPRYQSAALSNGLVLYVIEDHRQPTIAFRLQVRAGSTYDTKPGIAELMAALMSKGTRKRSALDIANALDSVGADLDATSSGELLVVSIGGLKKHMGLILSVFADIVQNPTFPKEELEKYLPQMLARIKQDKTSPGTLANTLSRMVLYGAEHPNARHPTEESVKSITVDDLRAFHDRFVRPNNTASLAIYGDITLKEILPQIEAAFRRWQPTNVEIPPLPEPKPMPQGVYFIERPGSVQSTIMLCGSAPRRRDPDYEKLSIAIELLGNGFTGRLFKTLRETYSFTYSPYAFLSQGKLINRFAAAADVRTAVTDSAMMVLRREVEKVATDPADESEISVLKQNILGSYQMHFEEPRFVASLLQSAQYHGLTEEHIKGYPQRVLSYSPYDLLAAAERYLQPRNWWHVVVGNPDIAKELERYGDVYRYDIDLKPLTSATPEPVALSVEELLGKYAHALGGVDKLRNIQSLVKNSTLTLSAGGHSFQGSSSTKQKAPNKYYQILSLPIFTQEQWIDGTKAWMKQGAAPPQPMPDELGKGMLDRARMFHVLHLPQLGYQCTIVGKRGKLIILRASKNGKESLYYFDADTYLLRRSDYQQGTKDNPLTVSEYYDEYITIDGIKLPWKERIESPMISINSDSTYQLNVELDDSEFIPKD